MAGVPVTGTRYASFLLRLWRTERENTTASKSGWQGEAEHIQTHQRWTFDSLEELLRLLHEQLEEERAGEQA
jgi:hypothetical protein